MTTEASLIINAPIEKVWQLVTDIEGAKDRIECINDIQILHKPIHGLVGLKWKETRTMFGKEAVETMWITEAKENEYYVTTAENCGCMYNSTVQLQLTDNGVLVNMSFQATPQTIIAKLMSPIMMLMSGSIKKAFQKDLNDIKKAAE